ncbi:MAG: glutathione peroxidase, partial [Pseudomonadota bacterium]|nr:glutathione peroxidase [Pseudomonadota bacterium]
MRYLAYMIPCIRHDLSGCFLVFILAVALAQPGLAGSVYDYSLPSIDGGELDLASFKGQPLLVVNTASQCGFTGQYDGLQSLWETYRDRGLVVIG